MEKVRFSCPRCRTLMQTSVDRIGLDVVCPNCQHQFLLVESSNPKSASDSDQLSQPSDSAGLPSNLSDVPQTQNVQPAKTDQSSERLAQSKAVDHQGPVYVPDPAGPYHQGRPTITTSFRCPYCQTTDPPYWKSEVAAAGWIVFGILFCTTCFGCVIGLCIRERFRVCSNCRIRLE